MNGRTFWVLPFVFLLASCGPPVSVGPLGDPRSAPMDKELEGDWECVAAFKGGMEPSQRLRFQRGEGGVWKMQGGDKNGWDDDVGAAFTTIIGCDRYLNMGEEREDDKGDKKTIYGFYKYSVSLDGTLMLAEMEHEPVAKAIDEKRLQGKVRRNQKGEISFVQITDSSVNVCNFIEKEDHRKLFRIMGSFKKTEQPKGEKKP